jgi:Zn-finger nucleic acid-binding protein
MRLLVACPQCKRQYDATQLGVGTRFHCRCGQILTVPTPQTTEAKPVCCSHCGAPRAEGALSCAYCGAEFSLHDRDIDTVCPHCFARVSSHSRFCQFCGTAIHPEATAGDATQLVCPACGDGHFLSSRALGDVSVMECQRCGGMWLSHESFRQLTEKAAKEGLNIDPRLTPSVARAPQRDAPPPDGGLHYQHCPACQQLMTRQNYGHASSVIVDICGRHGVWLDADDLPRIIEWIQGGGLVRGNEVSLVEQAKLAEEQHAKAVAQAKIIEQNAARSEQIASNSAESSNSANRILSRFSLSPLGIVELVGGISLLILAGFIFTHPDSSLARSLGELLSLFGRHSSYHQSVLEIANHNPSNSYTAGIASAIAGSALLAHCILNW